MAKNWVLYLERKRREEEEKQRGRVFYDACVAAANYIEDMYGFVEGYPSIVGESVHFMFAEEGRLTRITLPIAKCIVRPGVMLIKPYLEEELKKCAPEKIKQLTQPSTVRVSRSEGQRSC